MNENENIKPIVVENLKRVFGDFVAVDDITFNVSNGEIFGFLGPNGSGKSTTIKMLTGLLMPSGGKALVAGIDVSKDPEEVRHRIGYMSQRFNLYQSLTVIENLEFYADIYEVPKNDMRSRIDDTITRLDLGVYTNQLARDLPAGIKQRLALGVSYIHKPEIFFLDEPTAGVDPSQRRIFWDWIYDLSASGAAIFVTTHYMDEVEYCSRVGLISEGNLIAIGTTDMLKMKAVGGIPIIVEKIPGAAGIEIPVKIQKEFRMIRENDSWRTIVSDNDSFEGLKKRLKEENVPFIAKKELPSMDDVFIALMKRGVEQ